MAILEPELAILDETDSGSTSTRSGRRQRIREARKDRPHWHRAHHPLSRLLDELTPDRVHILIDGRIVESGGPELPSVGREATKVGSRNAGSTARACARLPDLRARAERPTLVYLDSAATSQKPRQVIDTCSTFSRPRTPRRIAARTRSRRRPPRRTRWPAQVRKFIPPL